MNDKSPVQEALKLIAESHIKYVSELQEARLLLNFALRKTMSDVLQNEISLFLEKTK
jgi:hypothetical protein